MQLLCEFQPYKLYRYVNIYSVNRFVYMFLYFPPLNCFGQSALADMIDQKLKIIADKRVNHGDKHLY